MWKNYKIQKISTSQLMESRLKSNNDQWMKPSDENLKGKFFNDQVPLPECSDPSYHH